jgi:hypothetical protein
VGRTWPRALILSLVLLGVAADARAQYFGRNKVQYDEDAVRVIATDHFDIYYSREDAGAALAVGRLAERWHRRLSRVLEHSLSGRQPLILYGSHRRFEQTNVFSGLIDENTGGFTESRKRRIVIPFAATLAETDHVLGHEIVHAFQYDIAAHSKAPLAVPLWFVEGMAEYLSLGPGDPLTAMWMRDAVRSEKLPSIDKLSSPKLFPYRWGAALWAFLADRYGADMPARALRARKSVQRRLRETTGRSIEELTAQWHASLRNRYALPVASTAIADAPVISSRRGGGRLNLAASISPDGTRMIFLSERDQFSIDLFLADAKSGAIVRKLITTAANADFESLQYLHSAGAWDPDGSRFALATIRNGRPAITILDIANGTATREIPLAHLDEVYSPTWAPDAHAIAFAALEGGVTDLYSVDVGSAAVTQLTHDAYADLQPAWSPDGRTIAFTTDRFTTDLALLRFGVVQFCTCFGGRRGSARLTARQAFGSGGVRFFDHLRTLGQELEGAHPRMIGQTETVALLRRHGDALIPLSVATRVRRPDRLTRAELGRLIAFMRRGLEAYAERANALRGELGDHLRALDPEALERLPPADL